MRNSSTAPGVSLSSDPQEFDGTDPGRYLPVVEEGALFHDCWLYTIYTMNVCMYIYIYHPINCWLYMVILHMYIYIPLHTMNIPSYIHQLYQWIDCQLCIPITQIPTMVVKCNHTSWNIINQPLSSWYIPLCIQYSIYIYTYISIKYTYTYIYIYMHIYIYICHVYIHYIYIGISIIISIVYPLYIHCISLAMFNGSKSLAILCQVGSL